MVSCRHVSEVMHKSVSISPSEIVEQVLPVNQMIRARAAADGEQVESRPPVIYLDSGPSTACYRDYYDVHNCLFLPSPAKSEVLAAHFALRG